MSTDPHPQYCPSKVLVVNYWAVAQWSPRASQVSPGLLWSPLGFPGLPWSSPVSARSPPGLPRWLLFKIDAKVQEIKYKKFKIGYYCFINTAQLPNDFTSPLGYRGTTHVRFQIAEGRDLPLAKPVEESSVFWMWTYHNNRQWRIQLWRERDLHQ